MEKLRQDLLQELFHELIEHFKRVNLVVLIISRMRIEREYKNQSLTEYRKYNNQIQ